MMVFALTQQFRYAYPAPIENLEHRLVVVPPRRHGPQRRVDYALDVRGADATVVARPDAFGNHRWHISCPTVEAFVEFESRVGVERDEGSETPWRTGTAEAADPRLRRPSHLTHPDRAVAEVADEARRMRADDPAGLAQDLCHWTHGALRYAHDATTVRTTAAEALAIGRGVCQDYAHVLLSAARAAGLAARYVSGHLVGEGGSHAWVEILVPDPDDRGAARVLALDPTNDRPAGANYVTVAVGRDYADVPPTSGTFKANFVGTFTAGKRLELSR